MLTAIRFSMRVVIIRFIRMAIKSSKELCFESGAGFSTVPKRTVTFTLEMLFTNRVRLYPAIFRLPLQPEQIWMTGAWLGQHSEDEDLKPGQDHS